jgi:TRAP-type mannitol/chloroaromatic compound transport system substrate-binding protein
MDKLGKQSQPGSRRRFLAGSATGALTFPAVVRAQETINLRFQSTWPTKDLFHEFALDFAKKVTEISAGRVRLQMLPSGSIVKPLDVLEAVHRGQIDGGHGVCTYWVARHPAYGLFGSSPAVGLDSHTFLAWMEHGGGRRLYDELVHTTLRLNVQGFLYGPMGIQPLGWFKRRVAKAEDLRGLRFRTAGLAIDMIREMGMVPTRLWGQEIVDALERGQIDAAEYTNPTSDRALGFPNAAKLCYLRSYHQGSEVFEVIINKRKFDSLPEDLQRVFRYAAQAASSEVHWKTIDRYATDYQEMKSRMGVSFELTPDNILKAQLEAWRRVAQQRSSENRLFARILESQQMFARRVVAYQLESTVSQQMAYDFWYGKK